MERKEKIQLLQSLLSGSMTRKQINESRNALVFRQYRSNKSEPGIYYTTDGQRLTSAQIEAIHDLDREKGILPFIEIKAYENA